MIRFSRKSCVLNSNIFVNVIQNQNRCLWAYVKLAFNRVDKDRLKLVGPDRLCAEWLLKNGGGIRTVDAPQHLLKDYNSLPSENHKFRIKTADGSNSSIMKIGLEHFNGCKFIDTVIFHNCTYLEPDGLEKLVYLNESLKILQVSSCPNITDSGLMVIGQMRNLQTLQIFDMPFITNLPKLKTDLQNMLPKCKIDIELKKARIT